MPTTLPPPGDLLCKPGARTVDRDQSGRWRPRASAEVGLVLVLLAVGWATTWAALELGDLTSHASTSPGGDPQPSLLRVLGSVAAGMTTVALAWAAVVGRDPSARHRAQGLVVLALAGVVLSGAGTALLHGTRWGMDGLYSDAGFRTQTVTRFADSAALADYTYDGLPAYYPPLVPWLQGRVADLLGVPGWVVMKPTQLLVCAVLPVLSWLLWRRVVPGPRAAWVAAVVAVATALPLKPDEWLVLNLVVPWWLEVCRGVSTRGARPRGAVVQGLVLGALLLTHTYFFAPLALATFGGMALDVLRRGRVHPRLGAGVVTGVVAVVVAAPSWVGPAWLRWQGAASDSLQLRWSPLGFERPPLPWPSDPRGVIELVGIIWLLWAVRRTRLAGGIVVALLAAYAFLVGGQLLQPLGVAVLPEKTDELIEALLAAAGVLGVAQVLGARREWWPARPVITALALATVVTVGLAAGAQSVWRGAARPAAAAQHMRYPDGSLPAGGLVPPSLRWHPWGVEPGAPGASVAQVAAAWTRLMGRPLGAGDVVVSARADLPATLPVHLFLSWKSIYSHPQGRFADRLQVLDRVAQCSDAACAHGLLAGNDVEAVDGLVLNRDGRGLYLSVAVDRFPEAWERRTLRFDDRLFAAPWFGSEELDGTVVVTLADGP